MNNVIKEAGKMVRSQKRKKKNTSQFYNDDTFMPAEKPDNVKFFRVENLRGEIKAEIRKQMNEGRAARLEARHSGGVERKPLPEISFAAALSQVEQQMVSKSSESDPKLQEEHVPKLQEQLEPVPTLTPRPQSIMSRTSLAVQKVPTIRYTTIPRPSNGVIQNGYRPQSIQRLTQSRLIQPATTRILVRTNGAPPQMIRHIIRHSVPSSSAPSRSINGFLSPVRHVIIRSNSPNGIIRASTGATYIRQPLPPGGTKVPVSSGVIKVPGSNMRQPMVYRHPTSTYRPRVMSPRVPTSRLTNGIPISVENGVHQPMPSLNPYDSNEGFPEHSKPPSRAVISEDQLLSIESMSNY